MIENLKDNYIYINFQSKLITFLCRIANIAVLNSTIFSKESDMISIIVTIYFNFIINRSCPAMNYKLKKLKPEAS